MLNRISEFDTWRPGYAADVVYIYKAGTTTLADVFFTEAGAPGDEAPNPQILLSMADGSGVRYGKFALPIYTEDSYQLNIDGVDNTGIVRPPFSSLDGESASKATISVIGSNYNVTLDKFASLSVNVAMYGPFVEGSSGVAATNTATLELAIAALTNGGEVKIPAGTYKLNAIEVPEGVIIVGDGREATTLQTVNGATSFLIVGSRAGFRDITLDGNSLSLNSIGVRSVGNDEIIFTSVMIRRFETGIAFLGGKGHIWNDFSIENTVNGAKLHGDTDSGGTNNGDKFEDLLWNGGLVSVATGIGVSMSYENAVCHNIFMQGVGFEDCLGIALVINGAQAVQMNGCWWDGNTVNVDAHDDTLVLPIATAHLNDVINVTFRGGRISGGQFLASGGLQNVTMTDMKLEGVTFNMVVPISNFLIVRNCYEDNNVIIIGDTTKFLRNVTTLNGIASGLTTSNVATKAWNMTLKPGQIVYLEAKVIGRGRNVVELAIYHVLCGAFLAGATLAYDAQSTNFTVGTVLTGAISGATARIQADTDSGTTGTLTLTDIKGTFIDNETITDSNGSPGSATVNGILSIPAAALDTVGNTNPRTVYETDTDFNALFAVNQQDVELRVIGDLSKTMEWTVAVEVVSN